MVTSYPNNINLFLIGFMGAGKSTVAGALQGIWGKKKIEMDRRIEEQEGMPIREIFSVYGEPYFREKETAFLRGLTAGQGLAVSCGGGVPMRDENCRIMRERGKVVWLKASAQTVYERVRHSHTRPLLEGNMNTQYIRKMIEERTPRYAEAADIIVETDNKTAEQISREIMEQLNVSGK